MSTIVQQEPLTVDETNRDRASLRVPAYDKAASLLIALLVLVGTGVFLLFVTWLSNRVIVREMAIPVIVEEMGGGVETGFGTEGMEIDAPQVSEVAQVGGKTEPKFADMVQDVVAATASPLADSGELDLLETEQTPRGGSSKGTGNQPARGTGGGSGGGSGSGVGTPRGQRWEIQFRDTDSLDAYARQLDFFGIELGVMGNTNQMVYVSNLSKPTPSQRVDRRDQERRLYMTWRRGALQQADRDLVHAPAFRRRARWCCNSFRPN